MAPTIHPTLHIGQQLKARKRSPLPDSEISDFVVKGNGILWLVTSLKDQSSQYLTLSEVYHYFEFEE